jgi:hypothetical protein
VFAVLVTAVIFDAFGIRMRWLPLNSATRCSDLLLSERVSVGQPLLVASPSEAHVGHSLPDCPVASRLPGFLRIELPARSLALPSCGQCEINRTESGAQFRRHSRYALTGDRIRLLVNAVHESGYDPNRRAPGSWQGIGGESPPRGRSSQPPRPRVMHEVLLARAAVKRSQGKPRAKY